MKIAGRNKRLSVRKTLIISTTVATVSLLATVAVWASPDEAKPLDPKIQALQAKITKGSLGQEDMEMLAAKINEDPNNAELYVLLAQCYDMIGMRDMAREQYAKAAALDPERMQGVLNKFKKKYHEGDPAEGFLEWVEVRKRFPSDPDVADYEHNIARIFGTVSSAEHAYVDEASHGHTLRSIDAMLSVMESLRGNYQRALKLANYDFAKHQTSDVLLAKSLALIGLKKYPAALVIAQYGYRRDFFFPGSARMMAETYVGLGNYKDALGPSLVNLAIWPEANLSADARKLFGKIIKKLPPKSLDEALELKEVQFVQHTSSGAEFHVQLAKALMEADLPDMAEHVLAKSTAARVLPVEGYMQYARILESKGSYKDALLVYNTGLQSFPDSAEMAASQRGLARKVLNHQNDLALRLKEVLRSQK